MTNEAQVRHLLDFKDGFSSLLVRSAKAIVEIDETGTVVVHQGIIAQAPSAKASFAKALKTGDVIPDGPNKDWIYCTGDDVEPFLVAPKDSGVMDWFHASATATREKAELPSRKQLRAMYEARNTGALAGTFNKTGSHPAGWYWSSTQSRISYAWCQRSSDGDGSTDYKYFQASVRCIRPYTPA